MASIKGFGIKALLIFSQLLAVTCVIAEDRTREQILEEESKIFLERGKNIAAQFYSLTDDEEIRDITDAILDSGYTKEAVKETILVTGRRFFVFSYPSDEYRVKGWVSFIPQSSPQTLLVFLRGGNRIFGLMNPATDLSCIRDYVVLGTAYRGGVSEGTDEFGGEEVNDVHHLLGYLPVLQLKLGLFLNPERIFMLGASRGGMEMFLALERNKHLQSQVTKAVSLSGLLDLEECFRDREDMRKMCVRDFGLTDENEQEWVQHRNPLEHVSSLNSTLPFLIIQGTLDIRTGLDEGYRMVSKLQENGNPVTYLEVEGADHCLGNQPDRADLIADWLEAG